MMGPDPAGRGARPRLTLGHAEAGASSAPVVVLAPGLGTRRSMFDETARALAVDHRVITVDLPGHGTSSPVADPFRLEDVTAAILTLLDSLAVGSFAFLGVSVSGAVGQALALAAPDRVRQLVVCASAAHWPDQEQWELRAARIRAEGVGFMVSSREGVWFSAAFAARHPERARSLLDDLAATDAASYAWWCDAIRAFDTRADLHRILTPTTVVVGDLDTATPPELAEELHAGIRGSRLQVIHGGYHLLPLEHPELTAELVRAGARAA